MNCPHCGLAIPTKPKGARVLGEVMYHADVKRAQAAITVLENCGYANLYDACQEERVRLLTAIENPAQLYAIYRRGDKKTPIAYGMI